MMASKMCPFHLPRALIPVPDRPPLANDNGHTRVGAGSPPTNVVLKSAAKTSHPSLTKTCR